MERVRFGASEKGMKEIPYEEHRQNCSVLKVALENYADYLLAAADLAETIYESDRWATSDSSTWNKDIRAALARFREAAKGGM